MSKKRTTMRANNKNHKLYVVTHTESFHNKRRFFSGWSNLRLTPNGVKQAKALAKKLQAKKIDVAFHSPLVRTKHTCKLILKHHPDTPVLVDPRIIERDYGKLTKKNKDKYAREHPEIFPIYHRSYDVPPPGGESMKQVEKRVYSFIKDLEKYMRREQVNVLVVTHSNAIRPFRRYFEKLTPKQMMKLEKLRNKVYTYNIPAKKK